MISATTIDTRGLSNMIGGLRNALLGQGGDVSTIVRDESKRLAVEIANVSKPKDRKKTADRIENSVRSKFLTVGHEQTSFEESTGKQGHTGVKWYRCDENFLFGVAQDKDMRKADPQLLANLYFRLKKVQGKLRDVMSFRHPRKHQRAAITHKIITKESTLKKAIAIVQKGIGRLPASWYATAKQLDSSLVAPGWIERHIHGNRTNRSITDMAGLNNDNHPTMVFGSRAAGASSFDRAINHAVHVRQEKVAARLRLVLSGYSKDVAHGIKIKRHAKESNGH